MNLQRHFNRAILFSFASSLLLVLIMYYFPISMSNKREMKEQVKNAAELQALSVDFTFRTFVTDIKALGSRTIIRKELHKFTHNELELEELIDFTQPKYADGARVIENLTGVRRVLTDATLVSFFGDQHELENHNVTQTGLYLSDEQEKTVIVVEPILEAGDTIGYDAGSFRIDFLLDRRTASIKQLALIPSDSLQASNNTETVYLAKLPSFPYALAAEMDPVLLQKRELSSLITVSIFSLVFLALIAVLFYFSQFRLVKKIIERLKDSEMLLNSTQRLTKAGGWEYFPDKGLMKWTKETFLIFGLQPNPKSLLDKKTLAQALSCFSPEDRNELKSAINQCIAQRKSFDLEYTIRCESNAEKWLRVVFNPTTDPKNKLRIIGTVMDTTFQKKAAQDHADKLELEKKMFLAEESAKLKQNFLANMSHEMRTPLSGILGMTQILEMTTLSEEQRDFVKTIGESGENLSNLVDKILDFSKIEAGNIELNEVKFSFPGLIKKTETLFYRLCNKPIGFEISASDKIPDTIIADETKIMEVIRQLLSNAVKFTEKGRISVKVVLSDHDLKNHEIELKFTVTDTGIGLKNHTKAPAYGPFHNLDASDARNYDGIGLGLAMSQRLVSILGGKLGLSDISGQGTRAWFTIRARHAYYSSLSDN